MSAKATFWAWEQNVDGLTKLVLLSLANYANDKDESWHSYANMAKATGISRQSVITHCQKLENLGLLSIKQRRVDNTHNLTNVFKLLIDGSQGSLLGVVKEIDQGSQGAVPKTNNKTKNNNTPIVPNGDKEEDFMLEVMKAYNHYFGKHHKAMAMGRTRVKRIKAIVKQYPNFKKIEKWQDYFRSASRSSLMTWKEDWKPDLDFLLKDEKFVRMVEGFYNKKP